MSGALTSADCPRCHACCACPAQVLYGAGADTTACPEWRGQVGGDFACADQQRPPCFAGDDPERNIPGDAMCLAARRWAGLDPEVTP